jgi:hypothetical protein
MIRAKFNTYGTVLLAMLTMLLSIYTNAFSDYSTNLVFSGYIQDSSGDIDVGAFSVPIVYDWDSDGKEDLLVGQRYDHPTEYRNGYITFYKNVGNNNSPFFNSPTLIQACSNTCNLSVSGWG